MDIEVFLQQHNIKYEENIYNEEVTEKDFLNFDFMIAYSRFELSQDFSIVRKSIIKLAEKGEKRALAFYFKHEDPKKWREDFVEIANKLKETKEPKTPEEWEIVANFCLKEPVEVYMYNDIHNVSDLRQDLKASIRECVLAMKKIEKKKMSFESWMPLKNKYNWLANNMLKTYHNEALSKAQLGYYGRFFADRHTMDAYAYLQLNESPDFIFVDEKLFGQICEFGFFDKNMFFEFLHGLYANEKSLKCLDLYTYFGQAYALSHNGNLSFRKMKEGFKMLDLIANIPYSDTSLNADELDEAENEKKEPPKEDEFPENTIFFG